MDNKIPIIMDDINNKNITQKKISVSSHQLSSGISKAKIQEGPINPTNQNNTEKNILNKIDQEIAKDEKEYKELNLILPPSLSTNDPPSQLISNITSTNSLVDIDHKLHYLKSDKRFIINHIEFSHDNNFLIIASNNGYRVIQSKTFYVCAEITNSQNLIGNISRASIFYNSSFVFFLGNEGNNKYTQNTFVVWDDLNKKTKSYIKLKEKILNYYFNYKYLILTVSNKALVFDILNLKFLFTICDIISNVKQVFSANFYNDDMIISKIGVNSLNVIDIFIYKNSGNKLIQKKINFQIYFSDFFHSLSLDKYGNLIVFSEFCNKIHIYNLMSNDIKDNKLKNNYILKLKACLYINKSKVNITNFSLSKNQKYFFVLINDEMIHIYKVGSNKRKIENLCNCIGKKGINIHGGIIKNKTSIIKKMFGQKDVTDCYMKINLNTYFGNVNCSLSTLNKSLNDSKFFLRFNDSHPETKEFNIFSYDGRLMNFHYYNKSKKKYTELKAIQTWIK